ncbi:hypothetical protein ES703_64385 [subsurface metagenome]
MRNKWIKRFFPLIVLLLLAPWPVAYAHDVSDGVVGEETVRVEVAEASAQPTWTAFGKAIGGVTSGDLFYIDATDNPADIQVTLYITNAQELIGCYRNLILEVGVYAESDTGEWEKASTDTFITMRNGQVSFTLPGYAEYKVTIDGGSYYCTTTDIDSGSISPQFYLEVD